MFWRSFSSNGSKWSTRLLCNNSCHQIKNRVLKPNKRCHSTCTVLSIQSNCSLNRKSCRSYATNTPPTQLTSVRYKKDAIRGNYSLLDASDVSYFTDLLGKNRVIVDSSLLDGYNEDFWHFVKGASKICLRPKTTLEVSLILKYCNGRKLAVCPHGGNTGVSGGCNPVHDEIIISMSLMNEIESVDELSGALVCQSGCILEKLNEHLSDKNLIVPLDLGAKASCQIGGNVSTNAGGLRLLRYGSLHSTVLGLEAVLADGTVMNCMSTMKKDNTGYDLKHLFIGSEGTLGIVTKVAIQCATKSNSVNLAFLGMNSYSKVLQTFKRAKVQLGEILSACEYIDDASIQTAIENLNISIPTKTFPFYMLIETSGSNGEHDEAKINKFLEDVMADGTVEDGTVATNPSHINSIWQIRERLPDALMRDGYLYCMDFSIPIEHFDEFVIDTRNYLGSDVKRVTGFGHLGDSNLHLHATTDSYIEEVNEKMNPFVYEWVRSKKGSVSAEHGLGFRKKKYLPYSKSNEAISMMRQLKKLFDPNNILNPYKVFPDQ